MKDQSIFNSADKKDESYLDDLAFAVCVNGESLEKYKKIVEKKYGTDVYSNMVQFSNTIDQQVVRRQFTNTSLLSLKFLGKNAGLSEMAIDMIVDHLSGEFKKEQLKKEEDEYWNNCSRKEKSALLEYLRKYPKGQYVKEAQAMITAINKEEEAEQNKEEESCPFDITVIKQGIDFDGSEYANRTQLRLVSSNAHVLPPKEVLCKEIEKCFPTKFSINEEQFEAYCPHKLFGWEEYRDLVCYPIYEIYDEKSENQRNDAYGIDVYYLSGVNKSNRTTKEKVVFWTIAALSLILSLLILNILGPFLVFGIWYWHCKKITKNSAKELEEICGKIVHTVKCYGKSDYK